MTSAYQWMVPFLHRCEKQTPGMANELLKEYLVTSAKEDLALPLKIFQHSKPDVSRNSNVLKNLCSFLPYRIRFHLPIF